MNIQGEGNYVIGYKMQQMPDRLVIGCPVYEESTQLVAIETGFLEKQVTFIHDCNPQSCTFEQRRQCIVKKEGKLVTVTKPAYTCDQASNYQYILNSYSFYDKSQPNMDRIP